MSEGNRGTLGGISDLCGVVVFQGASQTSVGVVVLQGASQTSVGVVVLQGASQTSVGVVVLQGASQTSVGVVLLQGASQPLLCSDAFNFRTPFCSAYKATHENVYTVR